MTASQINPNHLCLLPPIYAQQIRLSRHHLLALRIVLGTLVSKSAVAS